jgi:hypothetical protein
VVHNAGSMRFWLVFTGSEEQWVYLHRNESANSYRKIEGSWL